MSTLQGNNIANNQTSLGHDSIPTRPVSDNFSSSRSYAPECKSHISSFLFLKAKKKKLSPLSLTVVQL
jgi:hypothetical protein